MPVPPCKIDKLQDSATPSIAMTPKFPLVGNMRQYGGNFASKLADAMVAADPDNFKTLVEAFPQIVEEYSETVEN